MIRRFDMFSQNIMFTYKGESHFSTSFGGFISLGMLAAVGVYLSIQVQTMMDRSSSNNTLSTSVINLNIEDSNKTLVDYGFAFGVSVTDTLGRPFKLDPTLFTLDISQVTTKKVNGYYDFVFTPLGYKLCESEDLPGLSQEYLERGLRSSLYCPVNKRYNVAGNYLANNYQYVSVTVIRCLGVGCQLSPAIDIAISKVVISLVVLNNYMDFSDFKTPVKSFVDDRNYFYLTPTATKVSRVYLEQNEVVLDDDYLQIQSTPPKQFFSLEKTIVDIAAPSEKVINVSILLGPNKNTYSRSVFTIMDLFGNVGGIYGLLQSICGIIVGVISTQIMMSSVFRRLYYTNKVNFENLFIKVMDRSSRITNLPQEESKGEDLKSKFKSILSKRDESRSHSGIEIEIGGMNKSNLANDQIHRYLALYQKIHSIFNSCIYSNYI